MCVHVCGEGVRVCIEAKGTAEKTFLVLKLLPVFSHISSHLSCAKKGFIPASGVCSEVDGE